MKNRIIIIMMLIASTTIGQTASAQTKIENPLAGVYQSYFMLKDALVSGNGKAAQIAADSLDKAIAVVPMDRLGNRQDIWIKYQPKLTTDARLIKATSDIEKQRATFVSLSQNLYEVMRVIKFENTVYFQHCPMYNNKNGGANWLSLTKNIRNPYFGAKMMTCGKLLETIEDENNK